MGKPLPPMAEACVNNTQLSNKGLPCIVQCEHDRQTNKGSEMIICCLWAKSHDVICLKLSKDDIWTHYLVWVIVHGVWNNLAITDPVNTQQEQCQQTVVKYARPTQ